MVMRAVMGPLVSPVVSSVVPKNTVKVVGLNIGFVRVAPPVRSYSYGTRPVMAYPGKVLVDNYVEPKDTVVTIVNGDSGGGGAAAQADELMVAQQTLLKTSAEYHVRFNFVHIGDAWNAPYGPKSTSDILKLTMGLIGASQRLFSAKKMIVACNTASTTDGPVLRDWIKLNAPEVEVYSIIVPTAKRLFESAQVKDASGGRKSTHIGVLATMATTASGLYPLELAGLHAQKEGPDAVTIVHYSDDSIPHPRVFKGASPVPRNSEEEQRILKAPGKGYTVQNVYCYAPPEWVSHLEGKHVGAGKKELDEEVRKDMMRFFELVGINRTNLSVLGLCCTHYPIVKEGIESAFKAFGEMIGVPLLDRVQIVSQGALIAQGNILPDVARDVENGAYLRRQTPDWSVGIHTLSVTTGWPGNPSTETSVNTIKTIFSRYPKFIAETPLKIIPPFVPVQFDPPSS